MDFAPEGVINKPAKEMRIFIDIWWTEDFQVGP